MSRGLNMSLLNDVKNYASALAHVEIEGDV